MGMNGNRGTAELEFRVRAKAVGSDFPLPSSSSSWKITGRQND